MSLASYQAAPPRAPKWIGNMAIVWAECKRFSEEIVSRQAEQGARIASVIP